MNHKFFGITLIGAVLLALLGAGGYKNVLAAGSKDIPVFHKSYNIAAQQIYSPVGIAVDGDGNIFLTDNSPVTPRVLKYDKHGDFVKQWGSKGSGPGQFEFNPPTPDAGPPAGFHTVDQHGFVYVSDAYNFRVQKFDTNGNLLMMFGSQGEGDGQFDPPCTGPIYVDVQGNIYVSTFPRVQKFSPDGEFLASYGSAGSGDGEFMGAGIGAIDSQGNMYITDLLNARIQKLDKNGNFLQAWGSPGTGDGQFYWPVSIVMDEHNRLYVNDNTTRGQVFTTDGEFLGQWSDAGKHNPPLGFFSTLWIDGKGDLYLADVGTTDPTVRILVYKLHP